MRRKEKQITDIAEIENIIQRCPVCRLGLSDGTEPYVVPVNFGYQRGTLWLHSAREGRKIEILRRNPRVCLEFDLDFELKTGREACSWSARYRSALAFGTATIIDDPALKRRGLDVIMAHYSENP